MKYIVEYDIPKEVGEPSKTHNTPFLSPSNAVYLLFFFFSVNSQLCFFKMLSFYLLAIRYISTSPLKKKNLPNVYSLPYFKYYFTLTYKFLVL